MATYTVAAAAPAGLATTAVLQPGAVRTAWSATAITYINPDGTRVQLSGSGFAFDGGGAALSGFIGALTLTAADGAVLLGISGLAVALPVWHAALAAPAGGVVDPASGPLGVLLAGGDSLSGSLQADLLFGFDGNDSLAGGAGDDILAPGRGSDSIDGGAGSDLLNFASDYGDPAVHIGIVLDLAAGSVVDPWGFTDGFTSIEGARGTHHADQLTGDGGDNRFEGLDGNDRFDGGAGFDTVSYAADAAYGGGAGVTVNLADGTAVDGFGAYDTLVAIEAVVGTEAADTFAGADLPAADGGWELRGLAGDDIFVTGHADLVIEPGAGADTILGTAGHEEVSYAAYAGANGAVFDFAGGTIDDPYGATDTVVDGDAARMTANGDRFIGNGRDNAIAGLGGSDAIDGGAGFDEVRHDLDARHGGQSGVVVNLAAGFALDGFGAVDTLDSIEAVRGTSAELSFLAGVSDLMFGSAGDERFAGLGGLDLIDGGGGSDLVDYAGDAAAGGGSGVVVDLGGGVAHDGFGTVDILIAIANVVGTDRPNLLLPGWSDVLLGSDRANVIEGRGGDDLLSGGAGDDTLIGGAGMDQMIGGAGADLFAIDAAAVVAGEVDLIADFAAAEDRIRLPAALAGRYTLTAGAGQVTLVHDTGSGAYALGILGSAGTAEVAARIVFD